MTTSHQLSSWHLILGNIHIQEVKYQDTGDPPALRLGMEGTMPVDRPKAVISVTLDTTAIRDLIDERENKQAIDEILDLQSKGRVSIAVTKKIHQDIPNPPLSNRISELPELGIDEIPAVGRLGVDFYLGESVLASEEFAEFERWLEFDDRSPGWKDMDHLHTHFVAGRDIFVTSDKGILKLAQELREKFHILIAEPSGFMDLYVFVCKRLSIEP